MDGSGKFSDGPRLHSRLSRSSEDLLESETFETSRTKGATPHAEMEMQKLSRQMKKKSQSMESLDDILSDTEGQSEAGVTGSDGCRSAPLPHRVETRETQAAESLDENIFYESGTEPTPGELKAGLKDTRSVQNMAGTVHYATAERQASEMETQLEDGTNREMEESVSRGKVDIEAKAKVTEQRDKTADGTDITNRLSTESQSVNMDFKDTQDSSQQQRSSTDDWQQEASTHEETAISSSKHHEKTDLSKKVGDSRPKAVASMEVDASEDSERYTKRESEKLEKDGQKREATRSQEQEKEECYEKMAMAAKTDKGEVIEESGAHQVSNKQKLMDEKKTETCKDGVLKRSSSMEFLESENTENTECDRQTIVQKDDSGKTRQSSTMKSNTQKESSKRAMHQESSSSSSSTGGGTPEKMTKLGQKQPLKFEPRLGSWGSSLGDRERVFDKRLGKYITKLTPPAIDEHKRLGDQKPGDKVRHANTRPDKGVCRDNRKAHSQGLSPLSPTPAMTVSGPDDNISNADQESAMSDTSVDYNTPIRRPAPIGTIDELDDLDEDWASDSGFDTLSTWSTVSRDAKSPLTDAGSDRDTDYGTSSEAGGQHAQHTTPEPSIVQNANYVTSKGDAPDAVSGLLQQQDTVGAHQVLRYDDDDRNDASDKRRLLASQGGLLAEISDRQDMRVDSPHDKPPGVVVSRMPTAQLRPRPNTSELYTGSSTAPTVAELSPSVAQSALGQQRPAPAKFVSTSEIQPQPQPTSSAGGRGPRDGISINHAKEYTNTGHALVHSSDPSLYTPQQHQASCSKVLFSDPAQACGGRSLGLSASFGAKEHPESVHVEHGAGKTRGEAGQAGWKTVCPCLDAERIPAQQSGASCDYNTVAQSSGELQHKPADLNAVKSLKTAQGNLHAGSLGSADIFALDMDDIKDAEGEDLGQSDPDVQSAPVRSETGVPYSRGTSHSVMDTMDRATEGMCATPEAMNTMNAATQHIDQSVGGNTAGLETQQQTQPPSATAAMASSDNPSSSSSSSASQSSSSDNDSSSQSGSEEFELDDIARELGEGFEDIDSEMLNTGNIMAEMNTMEMHAAADMAHSGISGQNETDISEQGDVSGTGDSQVAPAPPGPHTVTDTTPVPEKSADERPDISEPESKKQKRDSGKDVWEGAVESNVDGSDVELASEPESEQHEQPSETRRDGFDSELDVQALEKDAELSEKERVPVTTDEDDDEDDESSSSSESSELLTLDNDGLPKLAEDKITQQNVVQAMQTLINQIIRYSKPPKRRQLLTFRQTFKCNIRM